MGIQVNIAKGYYRNKEVSGIFPLHKPYNAKTSCITIKNPNPEPNAPPIQRITIEPSDFTLLDEHGQELGEHVVFDTNSKTGTIAAATDYEQVFVSDETEEEAMLRISDSFLMLDEITDACAKNNIRGLVVSGPPGIGKSFGVEKQLEQANMFRKIASEDPKYEIISGGISSIGLYQKLYYNRSKEHVLVFDDADGVFEDTESLNLLKAALNSGDKRRICWNKESRVLNVGDLPESFDFEASVIFLTNIDFEKSIASGSKIGSHLAALMSRCHYLDLEIGSMRDRLLRIKQCCRDGMLNSFNFTKQQEADIVQFVFDNSEHIREISLRMVKKIADLMKADPTGWQRLAEATTLKKEAHFRILLAKRATDVAKRGIVLSEYE